MATMELKVSFEGKSYDLQVRAFYCAPGLPWTCGARNCRGIARHVHDPRFVPCRSCQSRGPFAMSRRSSPKQRACPA